MMRVIGATYYRNQNANKFMKKQLSWPLDQTLLTGPFILLTVPQVKWKSNKAKQNVPSMSCSKAGYMEGWNLDAHRSYSY